MYVVMQKKVAGGWQYAETNDHGDVVDHATEALAMSAAARLGGQAEDMVVVDSYESMHWYQYGCPVVR